MSPKDYFKLTIKVRGLQTRYFATRDNAVKAEAIENEKLIDSEIARVALKDDEIYQYVKEHYPSLCKIVDKMKQLDLFK